jgi:hypothetical protein
VRVTLTPPPPLLISWLPGRPSVSFSDTLRITRVTDALTLPLAVSSSLAMSCLMSRRSLTPPLHPHLPLTLRRLPSFPLTRRFRHPSPPTLQVLLRRAPLVVPRRPRTFRCLTRSRQPRSFHPRSLWLRRLPLCRMLPFRSRDRAHRPHLLPGASVSSTSAGGSRVRPHLLPDVSGSSTSAGVSRLRRSRPQRRRRQCVLRRHPHALAPTRRCTTHLFFTGTLVTLTRW